ncbi:hypothetical protein [Leptospira sp. id769339]|uniref:hypothetical protein n=1 Tax=Leptospira sp. id769339 TaxID=2864221 RepID=UPI00214C8E5C|nr:hypothetical protein [Leptospira sp. id769339]MCR1795720.1 hypothetical protein [Leptospira sp. id769339]
MKTKNIFIVSTLIFALSGILQCQYRAFPVVSVRSGTINDDDIEEPLSDRSKPFENYLITSNNIVSKLTKKDLNYVYDFYLESKLKEIFPKDKFIDSMTTFSSRAGKFENFKLMQWNFVNTKIEGNPVVQSIKIVHHSNNVWYYIFTFDPGNHEKIVGIKTLIKNPNEAPRADF